MKHLSIRFKITFWFTAALILVVCFTYFIVFSISNQIIQKTIKDNLIETVENNVDEVEYYSNIDNIYSSNEVDHYIEYKGGYLEIDDDFLDEVNEVYTALYNSDIILIYGENPISLETSSVKFIDSLLQKIRVEGVTYYIFDRKLTAKGLDNLWMRGVVSETQGSLQMSSIERLSLIVLPVLVLLAFIGGYLIAGRMLKPIQKITETANRIGKENDLKRRIELGEGEDELHRLAKSFNETFEKLDKTFETQSQFISDASHELRTPVTVILSQCELSLEKKGDTEEYEEALRVIQRQSRRMSKLINNMLDFTRLESGTERYAMQRLDMTELVTSVCSDMALIRENSITLQYETEKNIFFNGNRELLLQLVTNLISNAYRYGKENGHIWVGLKKECKCIRLSVSDDGIGIEEKEQEKIFRRFYQTDNSRRGVGLGLGLSMASEIAKLHGGKISVESEPGKGSVFTLLLFD